MASSSVAFDQFGFVGVAPDAAEAPRTATYTLGRDSDFEALVQEIREHEGEIVSDPPLLFKLLVAVGLAMTVVGGIGLAWAGLELAGGLV